MDKLGALLFLAGIGGIITGSQGVYTVATNWTPTTMDCADYVREKPSAKWLKLENCRLDLENAYSSSVLGLYVSELLVPVQPIGSRDETIHILLSTDGEGFEDFVERLEAMKDEQQDAPDEIEDTVENLAEDWILLDEGKEPDRGEAFGTFAVGLLLLPVSFGLMSLDDRSRQKRPSPFRPS